MERAGIVGSIRAGRLRLAFHLYNTAADADRAAEVVAGRLIGTSDGETVSSGPAAPARPERRVVSRRTP